MEKHIIKLKKKTNPLLPPGKLIVLVFWHIVSLLSFMCSRVLYTDVFNDSDFFHNVFDLVPLERMYPFGSENSLVGQEAF